MEMRRKYLGDEGGDADEEEEEDEEEVRWRAMFPLCIFISPPPLFWLASAAVHDPISALDMQGDGCAMQRPTVCCTLPYAFCMAPCGSFHQLPESCLC